MSYKMQKDKKRKRRLAIPALFLLLLAALAGGGMKLGIIPGGEAIFGEDGIILPQDTPAITSEPAKNYEVVVAEDTVQVNGETVTLDELNTIFLTASDEDTFQIKDNQAIKETFEEVIRLADRNQIQYQLIE